MLTAQNVTVKANNKNVETVFAELMKQTGKNFVYSSDLFKGEKTTVSAVNEPFETVLNKMFANTDIAYKIKGNNVMLMRKAKSAAPKATAKNYTVSGFVRESGSHEAIIGAVVSDSNSGLRTATNNSGFYSLTIPAGNAEILVEYTGFENYSSGAFNLAANRSLDIALGEAQELQELVVVGARNNAMAMETAEIGSYNLSNAVIKSTPVIFGESDVIKTLQLQPGVSAGTEGMAGMFVHGGNSDENLYMLDNIPLYQVNHFGGLFSAFNTEAIRNVDFYKSSYPAKYDGRLSSYMDVHTKDGSLESHHGSFTLGLTSGAFNIDGPIKKGKTSYSLAVRRSWYDALTAPLFALANKGSEEKTSMRYAFMDINAKINHHFSDRSRAYVMFYYGDDYLGGYSEDDQKQTYFWYDKDEARMHWGNIVASAGWNYVFSPKIFGEITGAYTRYYSKMSHYVASETYNEDGSIAESTHNKITSNNNINDWIVRADFDWRPNTSNKVTFGANFTYHSFLPSLVNRQLTFNGTEQVAGDSTQTYHATELNAYFGDDWTLSDKVRINFGVHGSLFNIEDKTYGGISPRLSLRYTPAKDWAIKAGYSRAYQYVHQLTDSYISLPTDRWIPVTAANKPQSSDKVSIGGYKLINNTYAVSVEGYYKWMHNILDYKDNYYLVSPLLNWDARLTSGKGTAKGVDIKLSKETGKITGHIAYSLLWADRTFADKNDGKTYPARNDNRHKINILLNWKISDKWEFNAAWTGMSGNRMTLPTQVWESPDYTSIWAQENALKTELNNYRLPFYHRLDLSFIRHNRRGFWTFSVFNAYCNMNTVAVVRSSSNEYYITNTAGGVFASFQKPAFKQLRLLPIIPTVSYTWKF